MSIRTIKNFPYKNAKVLAPLKLGKYFTRNGYKKDTVKEMDWFDKIKINDEITVTMLPSQHWSKRWIWGDGNTNRSLWGSFLIEYKDKKIFFACDTGPAPFYKDLGEKFGPIDLGLEIWVPTISIQLFPSKINLQLMQILKSFCH